MYHNCKAVYFQSLWVELFTLEVGDAERLKEVMEQKGCSCTISMNFNFSYIDLRMKITVPLPHILYCRIKAVLDFF